MGSKHRELGGPCGQGTRPDDVVKRRPWTAKLALAERDAVLELLAQRVPDKHSLRAGQTFEEVAGLRDRRESFAVS